MRASDRVRAPRPAPSRARRRAPAPRRRGRLGGLGRRPHDREDRPLDRAHDGLVGRVGRPGAARRDVGRAGGLEVAERVGEAPQDLGEDHAGVAPGAHQRAVGDGLADLGHVLGGPPSSWHHRLEGQRHVRAGVAVGDRVDVQPVQLVLVGAQRVPEPGDGLPQIEGGQPLEESPSGAHRTGRAFASDGPLLSSPGSTPVHERGRSRHGIRLRGLRQEPGLRYDD